MRFYGKEKQDRFAYYLIGKTGTFLDIGCYHPVGISNTFLLHKKGWQGVVVDIDDYKLKLFKKRRGKS